MIGGADFSPCGRYRYTLRRRWLVGRGSILWILLNPSTATAETDDPTIRRCIRFAQSWGYQRMALANIFALRSTDPRGLLDVDDPVGPENDRYLKLLVGQRHDIVVCAWGVHGVILDRGTQVADMLSKHQDLHALTTTKDGHPRHPLYLKSELQPRLWRKRTL